VFFLARSPRRILRAVSSAVILATLAGGWLGRHHLGFATHATASPATVATASGDVRIYSEPSAGFDFLYQQVAGAKHSIDVEMYELADTRFEQALTAAVARGVTVRVLLDAAYHGKTTNTAAHTYLTAHGVHVRLAPSGVIFHIKTIVIDGKLADVSTANLTSRYYSTTVDAVAVTPSPVQVHAIAATFSSDYAAAAAHTVGATVAAPGLVWSPGTSAQAAMLAIINGAKHTIAFEGEELSDKPIYAALARAARRGVTCDVLMTNSSQWATAYRTVTAAGCHVHVYPDRSTALYIHEKLLLADATTSTGTALLSSQNATKTSLTRNRELGIELHGHLTALATTYAHDAAGARTWTGAS
jgi:phosphatidylserine/phosphatidylglycerophosphate/cardiolipin synthase-like enzyme